MMDWQQPVSLAVVALAGFLFVRHEIRTRRRLRSRGCPSDCGCGNAEDPHPADAIARPGMDPENPGGGH